MAVAHGVGPVMHQGLRDPGSRQGSGRLWKVQTLDRDSGDPGLPAGVPLGRYSGCSHGVLKNLHWHAPGFRSLGVFRECRGECEEEEAEQVQPLRRAVVGHRRSSHCTLASTQDGRSRRSMANVRRSTTRPIPFGGRSARCSTRTRCA